MNIYPNAYLNKVQDINIEFLMKNRSEVFMNNSDTKDFVRKYNLRE